MENCAMIFDIQRMSSVDGPGIRTTVFFKGCNLRCLWCHNPEGFERKPQMLFYKDKCIGCGKCKTVCSNALQRCDLCGKCTVYCEAEARRICGKEYTVDELFAEIKKDKRFYENSGGGVTFSGGECMLQIDFLVEIMKKCKENGIATAVDTAGNVSWTHFQKILPYTDLFLYDVKCYSDDLHKKLTGVSNLLILENLKRLSACANVIARIPVIPNINDDMAEMQRIKRFLQDISIKDVQILPYHGFGEKKYEALGLKYKSYGIVKDEKMEKIQMLFSNQGNG